MVLDFSKKTFFSDARAEMDANKGMCVGTYKNGALNYVVFDPLFYRLQTFIRPISKTFTDGATLLTTGPDKSLVINGNYFVPDKLFYLTNILGPGPSAGWYGEIIYNGTLVPNKAVTDGTTSDTHYATNAFIGREKNRKPFWRYHVAKKCGATGRNLCRPKIYETEKGIVFGHAMGGLLPFITDNIVDENRLAKEVESNKIGRTFIGLHSDSGCLFVLAQQHGADGLTNNDIVKSLKAKGVSFALGCDGSSSSALIVSGQILVEPTGEYKNNTIPTGLAFLYSDLKFGGPGHGLFTSAVAVGGTPDPNFYGSTNYPVGGSPVTGVQGIIKPRTPKGLTLSILSLGARASGPSVLQAMGYNATAPLLLVSNGADLRTEQEFTGQIGPSSIKARLRVNKPPDPLATKDDFVTGDVSVITGSGRAISGTIAARLKP